MVKKAIVVASFGTTYLDIMENCIGATEKAIGNSYPDYEIRRAFTSRFIIKRLAQRDGIKIDNTVEALTKLKQEGFQEVIVQPLHIIPGFEYGEVMAAVNKFRADQSFAKISLGRPLLTSTNDPDDFSIAVDALKHHLPQVKQEQVVLLMGHGSEHQANACYHLLQAKIDQVGLPFLIGTVEAEPTLQQLIEKLKNRGVQSVVLMPFMIVAGDHTHNDLVGDGQDSWKTQLERAGYQVDICLRGLGESPAYQQIYVQHIKDVINQQ